MPKHSTIRFWTDSDRYMGWKYLKNVEPSELETWLNSGNFVQVKNAKTGKIRKYRRIV